MNNKLMVTKNISLTDLISEETEKRKLITGFITAHLTEGLDYGTIKIVGRNGQEYTSKPSLFKPGSEKFCSLLHLRPIFERDNETWEMAGKINNLFCYKCNLLDQKGNIVGEGRGCSNLSEKMNWTVNNAVKIAEKRAQIDAVLRTGSLSDFFTQDLEDMKLNGDEPEKVMQRVSEIDVEESQKSRKCSICGTMGKYHKKGCPNGGNNA